ncbi:hypothetical protein AVEN_13903-1, partial [Araneus ventricosus]
MVVRRCQVRTIRSSDSEVPAKLQQVIQDGKRQMVSSPRWSLLILVRNHPFTNSSFWASFKL